jgi:hypothetical protein
LSVKLETKCDKSWVNPIDIFGDISSEAQKRRALNKRILNDLWPVIKIVEWRPDKENIGKNINRWLIDV